MDAILLDFSKAFDKVSHQRLVIKLDHYGICGNLLQWIKSFIANRTQQVLVEGHTSSPAPVTSGGTVLGPLLFLIYINNLPLKVYSTTCLFADDSLLYRRINFIKSPEDALILQEDLDKLQECERDWQMSFNASKCEVIRATRKRNPINLHNTWSRPDSEQDQQIPRSHHR